MIREGSGTDLSATIDAAPRALVFISVPWSGPERTARKHFRAAADELERIAPELGVACFRLDVDEDPIAQEWLSVAGFPELAMLGAGSLLWLESGQVISSERYSNSLDVRGIVDRTTALWYSQ